MRTVDGLFSAVPMLCPCGVAVALMMFKLEVSGSVRKKEKQNASGTPKSAVTAE